MKDEKDTSRRDFIGQGLLTVLALSSCGEKANPFHPGDEVKPSGEKVKLLSVTGEIIEVDKAYLKPVPDVPHLSNEEERIGIPGKKFAMVIDLSR